MTNICALLYRWNSTLSPFVENLQNKTQGLINDLEQLEQFNSSDQLSPILNVTNNTFSNSTTPNNEVPKELEIASLIFLWILSIIGCFIFFNLQKYLKTKAPGLKTILDEFYIKLITYWIFESFYTAIFRSVQTYSESIPWGLEVLLFYLYFLIVVLPFLHLLFSLMCNLILIFNPEIIEQVDDKKIIRLTM